MSVENDSITTFLGKSTYDKDYNMEDLLKKKPSTFSKAFIKTQSWDHQNDANGFNNYNFHANKNTCTHIHTETYTHKMFHLWFYYFLLSFEIWIYNIKYLFF